MKGIFALRAQCGRGRPRSQLSGASFSKVNHYALPYSSPAKGPLIRNTYLTVGLPPCYLLIDLLPRLA